MININKYDVIVISIVINEDQESRIGHLSHSLTAQLTVDLDMIYFI